MRKKKEKSHEDYSNEIHNKMEHLNKENEKLDKIIHKEKIKQKEKIGFWLLHDKQLNNNFYIQATHQHSMEYCIIDIFNTFLGNNREADEFYSKILPNYLCETYKIFFIIDIKNYCIIIKLTMKKLDLISHLSYFIVLFLLVNQCCSATA
mgnify:CR=1 FL=1